MRRALIYIHSPSPPPPPRDLRPWPERETTPLWCVVVGAWSFLWLTNTSLDRRPTYSPSSWVDQSTVTGLDCEPKVDVYINTVVVGIEYIEMLTERQSSDRVDCIL